MARFAQLLIGGHFATGIASYEDYYPGQQQSARIVLRITAAGSLTVPAIVDTGSPWCILDPVIIELIETRVEATYAPNERLLIRGTLYEGRLLRIPISIATEQGSNYEIDVTVFVPTLDPADSWPHPNFIGLEGFLNRIRFAIDPTENSFYFGPV
jgi:hypothetical protein